MPDNTHAEAPAPILQRLLEMESRLHKRMPEAGTEEEDEATGRAIHEHTIQVAREVLRFTLIRYRASDLWRPLDINDWAEQQAGMLFPLPRKVLREERVRDENGIPTEPFLYRVNEPGSGEVEWCDTREDTMDTRRYRWRPLNSSLAPAPNADRIRLWADLLANPYREEPQ